MKTEGKNKLLITIIFQLVQVISYNDNGFLSSNSNDLNNSLVNDDFKLSIDTTVIFKYDELCKDLYIDIDKHDHIHAENNNNNNDAIIMIM